MRRGEMLYPHAFTIAATLLHNRNDASIAEISEALGDRGPGRRSYHAILSHMHKQGYVERRVDDALSKDTKLRWALTESGREILRKSAIQYRFALSIVVGTGQFGLETGNDS